MKWVLKSWCFWTVVLEKTLESALNCKEIKPVNTKGNQSWIFIARTDAEAEAPVVWPPDAKSWLIERDPDAGKDWRQEEKETTTEDEVVGGHQGLDGHEFEQAPGAVDEQESLACCSSWGWRVGQVWATELKDKVACLGPHVLRCVVVLSCPTLFDTMECSTQAFLCTLEYWHIF